MRRPSRPRLRRRAVHSQEHAALRELDLSQVRPKALERRGHRRRRQSDLDTRLRNVRPQLGKRRALDTLPRVATVDPRWAEGPLLLMERHGAGYFAARALVLAGAANE